MSQKDCNFLKAVLAVIKPLCRSLLTFHGDYIKILSIYKDGDKFLTLFFKGENCGQALLRSSLYEFHLIKGSPPSRGCGNRNYCSLSFYDFFREQTNKTVQFLSQISVDKYASYVVRSLSVHVGSSILCVG